jgi:thiamine biosynthesis protein ThiS
MITIELNGTPFAVDDSVSILNLLQTKKIAPESVIVAHNLNVLNSTKLNETFLSDGDCIEILRFVAGG